MCSILNQKGILGVLLQNGVLRPSLVIINFPLQEQNMPGDVGFLMLAYRATAYQVVSNSTQTYTIIYMRKEHCLSHKGSVENIQQIH